MSDPIDKYSISGMWSVFAHWKSLGLFYTIFMSRNSCASHISLQETVKNDGESKYLSRIPTVRLYKSSVLSLNRTTFYRFSMTRMNVAVVLYFLTASHNVSSPTLSKTIWIYGISHSWFEKSLIILWCPFVCFPAIISSAWACWLFNLSLTYLLTGIAYQSGCSVIWDSYGFLFTSTCIQVVGDSQAFQMLLQIMSSLLSWLLLLLWPLPYHR